MIPTLQAPFPYFGGKSRAASLVWSLLGDDVTNYVEPFCGSAAMLLARPGGPGKVETVNDACGFIANFWRAVALDPDAVAHHADWPVSEIDLTARHGWLVNRSERLRWSLDDPDFYDAKIAGWWVWGACNWLGSGWCEGRGPWRSNGAEVVDLRQLPHLGDAGRGINRKLPHLGNAGMGDRAEFIRDWMRELSARLRGVRVACGDWLRVAGSESVTTRHGVTGIFLDPPYTLGKMDYAAGGVGGELAAQVRDWCATAGANPALRIVICGHANEHDALLPLGWTAHFWTARKGYAQTDEAKANSKGETVWASPACVPVAAEELALS